MKSKWFLLGLLALIAFDTSGQIGFKLTADAVGGPGLDFDWLLSVLRTPTVVIIAGAYLGSFLTYMSLMRDCDVGPLFAASHLELVTVSIVSAIWFGERFSLVETAGCLLILGGVVALTLTEQGPDADVA